MAIRQRKYSIFTRPFIDARYGNSTVKIFADKNTQIFVTNPKPPENSRGCTNLPLNKEQEDSEYWTLFFSSNSYEQIHAVYTKLLEDIGDDNIRISSTVPFDIITTPRK